MVRASGQRRPLSVLHGIKVLAFMSQISNTYRESIIHSYSGYKVLNVSMAVFGNREASAFKNVCNTKKNNNNKNKNNNNEKIQ